MGAAEEPEDYCKVMTPRPTISAPIRSAVAAAGLLIWATIGAAAQDCIDPAEPRFVYSAKVVRVYDGDTLFADIDLGMRVWLRNEPLRL